MYVAGPGPALYHLQLASDVGGATDVGFGAGNYASLTHVANSIGIPAALIYEGSATGGIAGDFFDVPWASVSRCALVDNSPNLILYSDQIDNAAWIKSGTTVSANALAAPDNTVTADLVQENTASSVEHYVNEGIGVTATAGLDYTFQAYCSPARSWVVLRMIENGSNSPAYAFFNLSTGAIGTTTAVTNWTNIRASIAPAGNGWYFCSITANKTNAATVINCYINSATVDNVFTYAGGIGTNAFYLWRASFAQSSTPFKAVQTTSAAVAAAGQTGTGLLLKGLPASASGLLLSGDWVECNGQLNQVVASLDSDAAGLGIVQLARPFRNSPADSAPFIINNPMGKFMVNSNTTSWNEQPGAISDATIEFVEDIAF
jgi:hypothetical protein